MSRRVLVTIFIVCLGLGAAANWRVGQLTAVPQIGAAAQTDTRRGDDAGMAGNAVRAAESYKLALSEDPYAYRAAQMLVEVMDNLPDDREALVAARQADPENSPAWHLFLCYAFLRRGQAESYYLTEAAQELTKARQGLNAGSACAPLQEARRSLFEALATGGVSEATARDVRASLGRDPLWLLSLLRLIALLGVVATGLVGVKTVAVPAVGGVWHALSGWVSTRTIQTGPKQVKVRSKAKGEVVRRNLPGDPPPVKNISEYNLQRIADGGLKIIYKGVNPVDKHTYAIAELQHRYRSDKEVVEHFRQGVLTLLNLQSARVVATYEFRCEQDQYYSVMEFLDGESLRALIDRERRLKWLDAYDIFKDMCLALKVVHDQGITHRDVKPDNFQKKDDIFKLLDFDTVLASQASRLTRMRGAGPGTPAYMAPEQKAPGGNIGPHTDVYALSVVLFEMLTGHLPNEGPNSGDLEKALKDPALSIPTHVYRVVLQAMESDWEKRFRNVEAFLNALTAA